MVTAAKPHKEAPILDLQTRAHKLAKRMPDLLVEARRAAHTVTFGIHGRRRAGTGETFWQFRHFQDSDTASLVDWRRSANSDSLFIREREWEAAHTVWLWPDISPSMNFCSHLAKETKLERALVLTCAMSDLLSRSGERVGLLGLMPPSASRNVTDRCAMALAKQLQQKEPALSLPHKARLQPHAECLLFSDFLEPLEPLIERLQDIAGQGVRGHLIQILDPAEETLPYTGRTEFQATEENLTIMSERAESMREEFTARMENHRNEIKRATKKLEWSFLVHHTDRPVEEPLLALHTRLSGLDHDYRFRPKTKRTAKGSVGEENTR